MGHKYRWFHVNRLQYINTGLLGIGIFGGFARNFNFEGLNIVLEEMDFFKLKASGL